MWNWGADALDCPPTQSHNPITATDLNQYFLAEGRVLADREGLGELVFLKADAERLPFVDGEFDIAFASTVMEECDADRMLKEMVRVVNPGVGSVLSFGPLIWVMCAQYQWMHRFWNEC